MLRIGDIQFLAELMIYTAIAVMLLSWKIALFTSVELDDEKKYQCNLNPFDEKYTYSIIIEDDDDEDLLKYYNDDYGESTYAEI